MLFEKTSGLPSSLNQPTQGVQLMHEKHVRLLSAALLIILVLFSSCSVERGENAGQGKTGEREKIELLSSSYTVKEYPLPLRADEKNLLQPQHFSVDHYGVPYALLTGAKWLAVGHSL